MTPDSRLSRVLLWQYERTSLPYEILCVLMLLFLLFVPAGWLGDPMAITR